MQHRHPYPTCFVCGARREPGDGLRVMRGPVPGREQELVAASLDVDREGRALAVAEAVWIELRRPTPGEGG